MEERKSGNTDFIEAEKTIEKTIRDMHIQEVDYFMEEFIPAYMKTLDELGKL
uniref:YfbR-like 5'-deoxynucleotidase n=1 Tax=Lachnospira sp. TaxID=2049031 RepID=UPI003FEF964D